MYWFHYSSHTSHHPSQTPCLPWTVQFDHRWELNSGNLGVIVMKLFNISQTLRLEPHHQLLLNITPRASFCGAGLIPSPGIQSTYINAHQFEEAVFAFWLRSISYLLIHSKILQYKYKIGWFYNKRHLVTYRGRTNEVFPIFFYWLFHYFSSFFVKNYSE